jgi:hypothetical protein
MLKQVQVDVTYSAKFCVSVAKNISSVTRHIDNQIGIPFR